MCYYEGSLHYIVLKCRAQEFVNHDCKLGAYLNLSKFSFQGLLFWCGNSLLNSIQNLCARLFFSISGICVIIIFQESDNFQVQFCSTNDSGILIPHTFRLSNKGGLISESIFIFVSSSKNFLKMHEIDGQLFCAIF